MIDGKVYNNTNLFKVFVTQKALCAIKSCRLFQNKAKKNKKPKNTEFTALTVVPQ